MPASRPLAIVTLAAATLGAPGCRTCASTGEFLGQVLGVAAAVVLESHSEDDLYHDFHDDDHHHHEHEHRCRRHR